MGQLISLPKTMARSMYRTSAQIGEDGKLQVITPPIEEWHPFIGGYGFNMNREIDDMIKTANRLQVWEWFRDEKPPKDRGYMYWDHENVDAISDNLKNNNHSGASFGMCMRQMQFIAENSWEDWNERNAKWNAEREAKRQLERLNQTDPGAHLPG
jgi:hypothetical protein